MRAPKSFEDGMARLETILSQMQSEETTLSESVKLYAEAASLMEYCHAALADSLSPYRVLGRGYAMVYDSKGRLCSTDALAAGDKLTLRGAVHTAECTVTSVEELNESTQKL